MEIWRRFLAQIVSFIVSIVLARILVPEDYGCGIINFEYLLLLQTFLLSRFFNILNSKRDATDVDFRPYFIMSLFVSIIIYVILFFQLPLIAAFLECLRFLVY
ncbi:MAG: oligosaccharide flippase family protein [Ruminococcus sp.]